MATGETVVMIALSIMMYQVLKLLKKLVLWRKIILMQDLIDSERGHLEPHFEESLFFY